MPVQTPSTYNPEAIVLVIDGTLLDGFANEGITIEQEGTSEYIEGMDGGGTFEYNASRVAIVTATFRAASAGAQTLNEIRKSAESDLRLGNAHPDLSGEAADPINGSFIVAPNVFFLNKPLADFGQQSGTVEFRMAFVNYGMNMAENL